MFYGFIVLLVVVGGVVVDGGGWWWVVVGGGGGRPLEAPGGHRGQFPRTDLSACCKSSPHQRRQDPKSYACLGNDERKLYKIYRIYLFIY